MFICGFSFLGQADTLNIFFSACSAKKIISFFNQSNVQTTMKTIYFKHFHVPCQPVRDGGRRQHLFVFFDLPLPKLIHGIQSFSLSSVL